MSRKEMVMARRIEDHNFTFPVGAFKTKLKRINANTFYGEVISIDLVKLKEFVQEYYGSRCKTFDINCPGCQMWMSYDVFERNNFLLNKHIFNKSESGRVKIRKKYR